MQISQSNYPTNSRISNLLVRLLLVIALFSFSNILKAQNPQNILDLSTWVAGNDQLSNFLRNGSVAENVRVTGQDPYGNSNSIIWKSENDAASDADGGWNTPKIENIDHTKTYRFTVWIKKEGTGTGYTLFGPHTFNNASQTTTRNVGDNSPNANPYFTGWTTTPTHGEWYLYVGYLHSSSYTGGSIGGIYSTNNVKVRNLTDFKMSDTTTKILHRAYLYYDTTATNTQYFFQPTIYEVDLNNEQPSIQDLVEGPAGDNSDGGGGEGGQWSSNTNGIHYNGGNVGIGVDLPTEKLEVNGQIHAREVKVDVNFPAPDYVFHEDYDLKTPEEIQNYIDKHGHLPNIPSAKEIEANGIELGLMNMKLLEKIEELTLYILEQDKKQKALEQRLNALENQN